MSSVFPSGSGPVSPSSASSISTVPNTNASSISTVTNTNVSPNYKILGAAGGYGVAFRPALSNTVDGAGVNYPENVTKLFYRRNNYNKSIRQTRNAAAIMGNNVGHRINTYHRSYKGKNLPASLVTKLATAAPHLSLEPENNVYAVRLPNLGVDIQSLRRRVDPALQDDVPILTILKQITKLLQQVALLKAHNYIHGDIRETNILIKPETGNLTIIDFDWTYSIPEFLNKYPFGFYCHPPETLYFYGMKIENTDYLIDGVTRKLTEEELRNALISTSTEYASALYNAFRRYWDRKSVTLDDIKRETMKEVRATRTRISEGDVDVATLVKTFDAWGLALTMLQMLEILYPSSTVPDSPMFALVSDLANADKRAVGRMVSEVLIPLSSFDFMSRESIEEVIPIAQAIVAELEEPVVGGGAASGPVGGAGFAFPVPIATAPPSSPVVRHTQPPVPPIHAAPITQFSTHAPLVDWRPQYQNRTPPTKLPTPVIKPTGVKGGIRGLLGLGRPRRRRTLRRKN